MPLTILLLLACCSISTIGSLLVVGHGRRSLFLVEVGLWIRLYEFLRTKILQAKQCRLDSQLNFSMFTIVVVIKQHSALSTTTTYFPF